MTLQPPDHDDERTNDVVRRLEGSTSRKVLDAAWGAVRFRDHYQLHVGVRGTAAR